MSQQKPVSQTIGNALTPTRLELGKLNFHILFPQAGKHVVKITASSNLLDQGTFCHHQVSPTKISHKNKQFKQDESN